MPDVKKISRQPWPGDQWPADTGKTLVGLLVAEATESTRTLVLVPSPSLLAQTLREWTANAERAFRYLAICSDETVVGEDAVVDDE